MLKIKKYEKEFFIIALVLILLLVVSVFSDSYIIGSTYNSVINDSIASGANHAKIKILSDLANLVIEFLTIKQIGLVSAQSASNNYCCEKTTLQDGGNWCMDGVAQSECDSNYQNAPTSCSKTSFCDGTCIDATNALCAAGSSKSECQNNGGTYVSASTPISQITQCASGCCNLNGGSQKEWTSSIYCSSLGGNFNTNTPQDQCYVSTGDLGACVFSGNKCTLTTQTNCNGQIQGQFYPSILCTNPYLNTTCEPTNNTECSPYSDGNVYFIDSCGNMANIYDSGKIVNISNPNDPNWIYWGKIEQPSCSSNPQSCGLCNSFSSTCMQITSKDIKPDYGNYMCKSISCNVTNDSYFPSPQLNGRTTAYPWESWCVYNGHVGTSATGNYSSDAIGGIYGLQYCNPNNQTIVSELSDPQGGRGYLCGETLVNTTQGNISIASNRINTGTLSGGGFCEGINLESYYDGSGNPISNQDKVYSDNLNTCNSNSDCRLQSVNVDTYFRFDICVPKYPPANVVGNSNAGAQTAGAQALCGIVSGINCTTVWRNDFLSQGRLSSWDCVANCNCLKQDFANQMNNLCISVGDCGGYVNVIGNYTKNFNTVNVGDYSTDDYNYNNIGGNRGNGDIDPSQIQEYLNELSISNSPSNIPSFSSPLSSGSSNVQGPQNLNGASIQDVSGLVNLISGIVSPASGTLTGILLAAGVPAISFFPIALGIIAVLAGLVLLFEGLFGFGKTKNLDIHFQCNPWQPPKGAGSCSLCNNGSLPCTQYMCNSLGQACQYSENIAGFASQNPQCISMVNDHAAPIISFVNISGNYQITKILQNNIVVGVNITEPDGSCIPAFTPLNISLETNNTKGQLKYSQCAYNWSSPSDPPISGTGGSSWTLNEPDNFSEGNYLSYYHTLTNLELPDFSSLPPSDVSSGNPGQRTAEETMYMRCEDGFNPPNYNQAPYVINFCGKETPDTQIATISSLLPANNSYLAYGVNTTNLIMKVNRPANCSFNYGQDEPYDSMTPMACMYNPDYIGLGGTCTTTLTGVNSSQNNFYIKCKDQPWLAGTPQDSQRNVNQYGFLYTLYDTKTPLNITSMSIQSGTSSPISLNSQTAQTMKAGTSPVNLQLSAVTSGGVDGTATCQYQLLGVGGGDTFISDIISSQTQHTQPFTLIAGSYNVQINCTDSVKNNATTNALFNIQIDNTPPVITRVYKSGNNLDVTTDEIANCYYSTIGCDFNTTGNGSIKMDTLFTTNHTASWNSGVTYYIKCADVWGNTNPECAIIASPSY